MEDLIISAERNYWEQEAERRALAVEQARGRGDAPHLSAAAQLRLREAEERLAALPLPDHDGSSS